MKEIKIAQINDLKTIVKIYNEYIDTTVTMDSVQSTVESKLEWFNDHDINHPIFCYELNSIIRGWVSISKWSAKAGYNKTVELSVYVSKAFQHRGIGSILIKRAIEESKLKNYHCIISRIDSANKSSIELHEKLGFTYAGTIKESGFKFGKFIDIIVLQLLI